MLIRLSLVIMFYKGEIITYVKGVIEVQRKLTC